MSNRVKLATGLKRIRDQNQTKESVCVFWEITESYNLYYFNWITYSAGSENEDDMYNLQGYIAGPEDSPYTTIIYLEI